MNKLNMDHSKTAHKPKLINVGITKNCPCDKCIRRSYCTFECPEFKNYIKRGGAL